MEIVYPDGRPSEFVKVESIEAGEGLVDYKCLRYMHSKLTSWLKQRKFACEVTKRSKIDVARLSIIFSMYEAVELSKFCEYVTAHRTIFDAAAPRMTSGNYHHFNYAIEPILHYCSKYVAKKYSKK